MLKICLWLSNEVETIDCLIEFFYVKISRFAWVLLNVFKAFVVIVLKLGEWGKIRYEDDGNSIICFSENLTNVLQ